MKLTKVYAVYFSPTGGAKSVAEAVAGHIARRLDIPTESIDFTRPAAREGIYAFQSTDLVIFATPVYAGRIPNKILPYVQSGFVGNGALAIPVAVFGNRSYDDGLSEQRNELEAHGFHTVAAAAVVTRHVFSQTLGAGRPDAEDMAAVERFSIAAADKIAALESIPSPVKVGGRDPVGPYYTPLQADGQPAKFLKAKAQRRADLCADCGKCAAVCPMGSISAQAPWEVTGVCIKCHACVRSCPRGARYFDDPVMLSHTAMLEQTFARRADSEFFLE